MMEEKIPLLLQADNATMAVSPPEWVANFMSFRERLFLRTVEPVIVSLLGPVVAETEVSQAAASFVGMTDDDMEEIHRRLGFLPSYVEDANSVHETSMSFATLTMLFVMMSCMLMVFLSCFYHNQKTSPLFISPRRHRLPKLVPPPLPVEGYFDWVKVCFYLSDDEIIHRIGYDALIFLRFHRLALRCIVKMSIFSFVVLLPLNYTGGGKANAQGVYEYVESLFLTDFMRFTMANVVGGSPRLWVHCFAAYLLTGIVLRELLLEYETFHSIRHHYLLSREPHLRTVLVTNIPRHLRSSSRLGTYFRHVYPDAVKKVVVCQNLIQLEALVAARTKLLTKIEKLLLLLCRKEKAKLFVKSRFSTAEAFRMFGKLEDYGIMDGSQERFTRLYTELEEINNEIEQEQRRRRRVMQKMDHMQAGEGRKQIDYILASPFVSSNDPSQRRVLGLTPRATTGHMQTPTTDYQPPLHEREHTTVETVPEHLELGATSAYTPNATEGQLRSRSPLTAEGSGKQQRSVAFDENTKGTTGKPLVKAKSAIRRYSRISRDVSLFGQPAATPPSTTESSGHIEDHINEVTDKAFVVMRTFTAATIAIQSMHSSKPGAMQVSTAPEPRDILWQNVYVSKGATRTRSILGEVMVILLISFYVVPVALISLLVSESALVSISPRLAQLDQATALFASLIAMVQPICIVTLQQLLPPLFIAISKLEGFVCFSEVQMRAFSRYFLFQVLNIFLVTTIAGSIFDTIAIIFEKPESAFEMLGNSLPKMSSFFITFVTIKTFLGLGVELVRTVSMIQAAARCILVPDPTLRTARGIITWMRAIDDPGWFPFHKILAQDMLVVVISVVFAVVAPLVLLPCALFCLFSRIMWTHHHLYVYESCFESGGQFWPKIFRRFIFGLIIAQMTMTGQFILKEARHQAYATIVLMFITYLFLRNTRARFDPTSKTLPLEVATVMDLSLAQEEEQRHKAMEEARLNQEAACRAGQRAPIATARSYESADRATQTTASLPDTGVIDRYSNMGSHIGAFDPFDDAYLQPALRANPRARPEQPFPPAQLGREEALFGSRRHSMSTSSESEYLDSGATVRLKSLNQQDRRLVNRWWSDQIQSAGNQNFLSVLVGEESGTLTIGRRTSLAEPASLAAHHQIV